MKIPIHLRSLTLLTSIALAASAHGQLLEDGFESYTPGANLDTSGPWSTVSIGANPVVVSDENTATPFGSPNQYLDSNDNSGSSVRIQSPNFAAASGVVTTFSFDFQEPEAGGPNAFLFGYSITNGDLTGAGARIMPRLENGTITNLSTSPADTYSLDTPYRLYIVFNDSASTINYLEGSLDPGVADIWLQPIGGPLTLAGTRNGQNTQTDSYRVGFRGYGGNTQQMLIDNVTLYEGLAIPGVPVVESLSPENDATGVAVGSDLMLTFNRTVEQGTGNIRVRETAGNNIVAELDVTDPAEVVFSGPTVTIVLPSDLGLSTQYYVEIDASAVQNVLGDPFPGIDENSVWSFTTSADSTPPTLLTTSPADDATGVAIDTNLVANFNEAVIAGTGNIVISNITEGTIFATIDISDATQITFDESSLTINPVDDLHEGRTYAVEIEALAITDLTGNPFDGISGTTDWDFDTVTDATNPVLVSTSPGNNATAASLTNNLVATFDEALLAGVGDITILNLTDATTFATIPVGDVLIASNVVTIDPIDNFAPDKTYAVQIGATALTDLSGNPFAGIVDPDVTTWSFKTTTLSSNDSIVGESEAGDVGLLGYIVDSNSSVVGVGGGNGNRTDRNLVLGYTLPTLPVGEVVGTVNFFFEITSAQEPVVDQIIPDLQVYLLDTTDPDASDLDFFFHGFDDLSPDVAFVGLTTAPVSGTGDNMFADDTQDRTFTLTGDALALFQSLYGGDHIPDQPEVFFRFGLGEDFEATAYRRYRVDTRPDESGLEIESVVTTPPVIISTSPADNTVGVYQGTSLVATFDRNIVPDSGDITIRNVTDDNIFATINVLDDFQVTFSGPNLTITPDFPLDTAKEYAIQFEPGVVVDGTGNPFGGIVAPDVTTWNFVTGIVNGVGELNLTDRIAGRAQSGFTAGVGYLSGTPDGRVGAGGGSESRVDYNVVFSYILPTLPVGTSPTAAVLNFEISAYRNYSGADPALNVYLLDSADPSATGIEFFYHGPSDPNPDALFVGATDISEPPNAQVSYALDEQEHAYSISGDALALIQSLYGGDHIPDQAEVYFRFNLDNLVIGTGDAELSGSTFDRYFVRPDPLETSLDIITAPGGGGGDSFADWISGFNVGGLTGVGDDADGDGTGNGVENFFGTAPDTNTPGLMAGVVNGGGGFTFTHPQNSTPASDLTAAYVWSKDLVTGFNADGAIDGDGTEVNFTTQADTPSPGMTTVTATVTGTATDKLFIRVEVTQN